MVMDVVVESHFILLSNLKVKLKQSTLEEKLFYLNHKYFIFMHTAFMNRIYFNAAITMSLFSRKCKK